MDIYRRRDKEEKAADQLWLLVGTVIHNKKTITTTTTTTAIRSSYHVVTKKKMLLWILLLFYFQQQQQQKSAKHFSCIANISSYDMVDISSSIDCCHSRVRFTLEQLPVYDVKCVVFSAWWWTLYCHIVQMEKAHWWKNVTHWKHLHWNWSFILFFFCKFQMYWITP